MMEPITAQDPLAQSADIVAGNLDHLAALFPEAFTEGRIDFEVLKQLLGGAVDERDEKYGLTWHGKRAARQLALTPSTGTLRPAPEDSVDWETTQNLMIEGDNLEVLKLLQKSYAGRVKLIYIDPPYNTGKDFVYKDDFRDSIRNYQEVTGQVEGGAKVSSNSETSGRFHTDWLNMMLPRLRLAKDMLSEDGVMIVSTDDNELDNVRKLCAEIIGEDNFVVQIIWKKRSTPPNDKIIGANHDYILVYAKNIYQAGLNLRERSATQRERYQNPDGHIKGPWVAGDLMANVKGGRYVASLHYAIVNPNTGEAHYPGDKGNWRFSSDRILELISGDEIYFGSSGDGRPKLKRFLNDVKDGITYASIWDFVPLNTSGSREMNAIFGESTVFESPKPVGLIQEIIKLGSESESLVVDFFAGSGTTGHAVMAQNAADGGSRRYILVQLPEALDPDNKEQKTAADYCDTLDNPRTIAELTKERLRRAGAQIKKDTPLFTGDTGFRVFKLDSSNIRAWDPNRDDLAQTLLDHVEHLVPGRTDQDLLYELLLKLGLDLCVPIETRTIAGVTVYSVGAGTLFVALPEKVSQDDAEPLALGIIAWRDELATAGDTTAVFRDSAFVNDVAKTNLAQILIQHGVKTVRSL